MIRHVHANGVVTLGFESLAALPVQGHVATRHGGVSPAPWQSLNFSVSRGDTPDRVAENRRRLAAALDVDADKLVRCQQVHGTDVQCVDGEHAGVVPVAADALITATPGVPLALVFADCTPILLYDTARHALGVCHAGWRGTVAGAAVATLRAMQRVYATRPADVRVGIGPSIGPASYEVGAEV
ncbi:MAG: polyphenol oxidase family protein, partial [Litorilinea sp.]